MVLNRVQSAYLDSSSTFPKATYASFIKYITDIDVQTSDEFWRARLAGCSPLQFPQNSRTDQTRSNHLLKHSVKISGDSAREVTIPTIIRAAWSIIVAAYSGSNDVVFGETLAGRDIPVKSIEDIIGPIFTTVNYSVTRLLLSNKETNANSIMLYIGANQDPSQSQLHYQPVPSSSTPDDH